MRILILDDYRPHGESLADLLESKGHEALYARSFADAEWLLELFPFEVAFLDFDMPGLTGPRVAALLGERHPALRCVIVSAHALDGARRAELGSLPFLKKPVPLEPLIEILNQLARERAGAALVIRAGFPMIKYR